MKPMIPIGSKVCIINPLRVVRVGYPISMDDAIAHVKLNMSEAIKSMLIQVGLYQCSYDHVLKFRLRQEWPPTDKVGQKTYNRIVKALAYEYLHKIGFGGKERTIHVKECPDYQGKILTVGTIIF